MARLLLATAMIFGLIADQPADAQTTMAGSVEDSVGCPALTGVQSWAAANIKDYEGDYSSFCGDFAGDSAKDVFAVIRSPTGGNSSYQDAVLFQNIGGQMRFLRKVPQFFGETKRAAFAPGKVMLEMLVMKPGDPRCCPSGIERREVDVATGKHAAVNATRPAAQPGAASAGARPTNPNAVTVNLRFSPRAAAAVKTITLRARYIGEPLPGKAAQAYASDLLGEDGYMMVGNSEQRVAARDGLVTIIPTSFSLEHARWLKNLLISIDTLGHPASVMCNSFLEKPMSVARSEPVTIACR